MEEVLVFGQQPVATARTFRGGVQHVDLSIHELRVRLAGEAHDRCVAIDTQHCTPALAAVVAGGGGACRIECTTDLACCLALHLMIDAAVFDAQLARGALAVEEDLIHLGRAVWREARVPVVHAPAAQDTGAAPPRGWSAATPLLPHQHRTVAWMRAHEAALPLHIEYPANLRCTDAWYLDPDAEEFTPDPRPRTARLLGGICADGTGSGKTASLLGLVGQGGPPPPGAYASAATLAIVPLNIVAQWQREVHKFVTGWRVHVLALGKEVRSLTMAQLLEADLIVTTFHFLRASKPYAELVDSALGGRPRTKAALSAWRRTPGHAQPLLEAVTWRRIVVDEIHETFENARDMRHLQLFPHCVRWGLTATPALETDAAQHVYALLQGDEAHHPNLLARVLGVAVRDHAPAQPSGVPAYTHSLQRVRLSAEERIHLHAARPADVAEAVRRCTLPPGDEERGAVPPRAAVQARLDAHDRVLRVLESAAHELAAALEQTPTPAARQAYESHQRDVAAARQLRDAEADKLARVDVERGAVQARLAALRGGSSCAHCGAPSCASLARCCTALLCMDCAQAALCEGVCPVCGDTAFGSDALVATPRFAGVGTKLTEIAQLLAASDAHAVLFVQWKSMVRGARAFLGAAGLRVLLLDGNTAQRTSTLQEFTTGGILLLCLEDSFAGLHLPHVRHIVFAHAIVADAAEVARLERQAIARCVRPGQSESVTVHSFIVTDSEEEHLWQQTHADAPTGD